MTTQTLKDNEVIILTKGCGSFKGYVSAKISRMSGEIVYTFAVTQYGGIWYKADWVTDKYWNCIGYKAVEFDFPDAWEQITQNILRIKEWQHSQYGK